jgi:hypothetical protein
MRTASSEQHFEAVWSVTRPSIGEFGASNTHEVRRERVKGRIRGTHQPGVIAYTCTPCCCSSAARLSMKRTSAVFEQASALQYGARIAAPPQLRLINGAAAARYHGRQNRTRAEACLEQIGGDVLPSHVGICLVHRV